MKCFSTWLLSLIPETPFTFKSHRSSSNNKKKSDEKLFSKRSTNFLCVYWLWPGKFCMTPLFSAPSNASLLENSSNYLHISMFVCVYACVFFSNEEDIFYLNFQAQTAFYGLFLHFFSHLVPPASATSISFPSYFLYSCSMHTPNTNSTKQIIISFIWKSWKHKYKTSKWIARRSSSQ